MTAKLRLLPLLVSLLLVVALMITAALSNPTIAASDQAAQDAVTSSVEGDAAPGRHG